MCSISIIIPFHNAQKYIKRCLDSILKQSYNDWEVILISDGSNDQSVSICNEYSKKDSRIQIYQKNKEGVSVARNYGLSLSKGMFIMFIDIDDTITPDCLETMIEVFSKYNEVDIVRSAFARIYPDKSYVIANKWNGMYRKNDIINLIIPDYIGPSYSEFPNNSTFSSIWATLYKKEIIKHIQFNPNLSIMEDKVFLIEALMKSNKIYFSEKVLYNYFINTNSTLNRYHNNYHNNIILALNCIKELCHAKNLYNIYYERINNFIIIMWRAICQNEIYANIPLRASINHIKSFVDNIKPHKDITLTKKIRLIKNHPTWIFILVQKYNLFIKLWRKHLNILSHE